jgi:hypothetical protein
MPRVWFAVAATVIQVATSLILRASACRILGHQPAWWYGVSVMDHDGPACQRCGKLL